MRSVRLKKGKEKPLLARHHWVFSGAIARVEEGIEGGEMVTVEDYSGRRLGCGYYNSRSQIRVRMLSFGDEEPDSAHLRRLISESLERRKENPLLRGTNALRLIHAEGDALPGLVVDDYNGHLVLQVLTLGMDRLRDRVVEILKELRDPKSLYERSDGPGREVEGLPERTGVLYGSVPEEIEIEEAGCLFSVDVRRGQKTGFFLDQRDNRHLIGSLAGGRRVLNLFSYTGGFTVAAARGGARGVMSVDASADALARARKNSKINGLADRFAENLEYCQADVFDYLRNEKIEADLIILDPPAFAKSRGSVERACGGYKDINRLALAGCPRGSFLLTCSCSRFVDGDLFQKVVFAAALDAGRRAFLVRRTFQPADHPVNLYHPEGEYLKALLLYVE